MSLPQELEVDEEGTATNQQRRGAFLCPGCACGERTLSPCHHTAGRRAVIKAVNKITAHTHSVTFHKRRVMCLLAEHGETVLWAGRTRESTDAPGRRQSGCGCVEVVGWSLFSTGSKCT